MTEWWEKPCMIVGRPMANGYSRVNVGGRRVYAHRHAWEQQHGSIPPGHHVHHRCHNRRCSAPEHLELLNANEHGALHARPRPPCCKTCGGADWYQRPGGGRTCRPCRRRQRRERYTTDDAYRRKHILVSNASRRARDG